MRRTLFVLLGMLELCAAVLLLVFAWQLPGQSDVQDTAGRIENVGRDAGVQLQQLRGQVAAVRKRQPTLLLLARKLETQMRSVNAVVRTRRLDGERLEGVSQALGHVATGLDSLATTLDPQGIEQIAKGLGGTADYLEKQVMPAAEKAADTLEKSGESLKVDAEKLEALFKGMPLELRAARASADSLAKFEDGLARMGKLVRMENLDAMREGFKGLETSLDTGAEQVERLNRYTIPKVTVTGLKINVEQNPFWPEGKTIAEGMRKAAVGCKAASKELDGVQKEMPQLRTSLEESLKIVRATRLALTTALANQEKLEPVLRSLPRNLSRMAQELPRVNTDLARLLRDTSRLKEVATALRQAEKGTEVARKNWPALRTSLTQSAVLVRSTQKQLDRALETTETFETSLRQTVELTALFSQSLPVMVEQLEEGLRQQEESLGNLSDSVEKATDAVPPVARSASRILGTTRMLLFLVALMITLHGSYQIGCALGRIQPDGPRASAG